MNVHVLPDVLAPGMRVVFCGTAAGNDSAAAGEYYANAGNKFWPTLHHAGFTPRRLDSSEFLELPRWGIGLTDVCKVGHGVDLHIASDDYDIERLARAMSEFRPQLLAFTSKRAAKEAFGLRTTRSLEYGAQARRVGDTAAWVLPSPSGSGSRYWSIEPWRALARSALTI